MEKNTLVVLTATYPYQGGEPTWKDQLNALNTMYERVICFPLPCEPILDVNLTDNLTIISGEKQSEQKFNFATKLKVYGIGLKIFFYEIWREKKRKLYIKNLRYFFAEIKHAYFRATALAAVIKKNPNHKNFVYHSTWLNSNALSLAMLKELGVIANFSFRVNGFDFQDERQKNGHVFFRRFICDRSLKIIALSNYSKEYLINKKVASEKIVINYGGKANVEITSISQSQIFRCVSCSRLVSLKRVDLIAKAIGMLEFEVEWVHFGDGPEMSKIREIATSYPNHIKTHFFGHVDQEFIENYYRKNSVNLFVHVSESEGLGMALIEAQRFGIPILACAAGGVVDIVNENTGVLLDVEINEHKLSEEIAKFKNSPLNSNEFRAKAKSFFDSNFELIRNAQKFLETNRA